MSITTYPAAAPPLDATLTTIAALTGTANQMLYFTGTDVAALTALSAFIRTLLDDADATTARGTLGLGTAATQAYEEGTFTATATGFSGTAPSGTARYVRMGKQVTLFLPELLGTSNATTMTITGLPVALRPTVGGVLWTFPCRGVDNNAVQTTPLWLFIDSTAAIGVGKDATGGAFTASGGKGIYRAFCAYVLD